MVQLDLSPTKNPDNRDFHAIALSENAVLANQKSRQPTETQNSALPTRQPKIPTTGTETNRDETQHLAVGDACSPTKNPDNRD